MRTVDFSEAKQSLTDWYYATHVAKNSGLEDIAIKLVLWKYYIEHASKIASAESARAACHHLTAFFMGENVSALTRSRQQAYVGWRLAAGVAKSTINRELSVVRAAVNQAHEDGELATVPVILNLGKSPARENQLEPDQVADLISGAADLCPALHRYILIGMNTLARPEAVPELTMFQVDFRNRLIAFNAPGREQTKKYRATVPITKTLLPILESRRGEELAVGLALKTLRRKWRGLVHEIDLAGVIPRDLFRHTMATELRRRGVPKWEVDGWLGHGGGDTTDNYAKFSPDYMSQGCAAIETYFAELQAEFPSSFRQVENLR